MKTTKTKRITAGILAAVMALGLAACGDVDESSSKKSKAAGNAKESSSVSESETPTEKQESSEADSADENSSDGESTPEADTTEDGYEFGLSLLGADGESTRELIKSKYPGTAEDTDEFQTENPVTVYIYNGDVSILGQKFDSMHFTVDKNTGKVISAAYVAKSDDSDTVYKLYEDLLGQTKEKYGDGEFSNIGDDELKNEYTLWNDGHISIQYIHSAVPDSATLSLAFEVNPMQVPKGSVNDIEYVEELMSKYQGITDSDAAKITASTFGGGYEFKDVGESMNALGNMAEKTSYQYSEAFEVLGESFWNVNIDYDQQDKSVYTVGFNKNTDINTSDGYNPTVAECEDSFKNLYAAFNERYGEPDVTYVPEQYKYNGALWKNTPAGEVWIAWGDKIFGSEQADCVMSFSRSGISGES